MYRPVAFALAAVGAVASTAHAHPSAPGSGDAGDGVGALALVLLAVAVVAGYAVIRRGLRLGPAAWRLGALAAAGIVVAALTLAAPHLVHHAFEPDQGAACPVLQIVGGTDATSSPTAQVVVWAVADAAERAPAPSVPVISIAFAPVRAPPV